MSWMSQGPRILRYAGPFAIGVSAAFIGFKQSGEEVSENEKPKKGLRTLLGTGTTNFSPITEWDTNWDR